MGHQLPCVRYNDGVALVEEAACCRGSEGRTRVGVGTMGVKLGRECRGGKQVGLDQKEKQKGEEEEKNKRLVG